MDHEPKMNPMKPKRKNLKRNLAGETWRQIAWCSSPPRRIADTCGLMLSFSTAIVIQFDYHRSKALLVQFVLP